MVEVEGGRRLSHRALSSVVALLRRGHCGVTDEGTRSTRAHTVGTSGYAEESHGPTCYRLIIDKLNAENTPILGKKNR